MCELHAGQLSWRARSDLCSEHGIICKPVDNHAAVWQRGDLIRYAPLFVTAVFDQGWADKACPALRTPRCAAGQQDRYGYEGAC